MPLILYFGTVLVEVSNLDVKAKIMKNKKVLESHANPEMKNLRIKNMKTQEQMNYEHSTRQLLKMVPGGDSWYVAGNGRLTQTRPAPGAVHPHHGGARGAQQQPLQRPQGPAQQVNVHVPPPVIPNANNA